MVVLLLIMRIPGCSWLENAIVIEDVDVGSDTFNINWCKKGYLTLSQTIGLNFVRGMALGSGITTNVTI